MRMAHEAICRTGTFVCERLRSNDQDLEGPPKQARSVPGRSLEVAPENAGRRFFGRNLRGRTMFDVGSIFQSVWAAVSDVILAQIMQLITDLLGGFLG